MTRSLSRLRAISMLAVVVALAPLAARVALAEDAIDVGDRRQVFIDGKFLTNAKNVELVVHPPCKTGEHTLVADRPWEGDGIGTYSVVHKVGDTYHLWYPVKAGICYARSKDGIQWEKPALGLAEYEGKRDNNIVLGSGASGITEVNSEGMVFIDPTAPDAERFRYATRISDEYKDTVVFSSPDGIHWKLTHKGVLTFTHPENRQYLDSQNVIFWDDRINKYVAYMRYNQHKRGFRGRSIARSVSDRLGGFEQVQDAPVIMGPDEQDPQLGGRPVMDYYTSGVFKYPWAQDAYYMFPQVYFHYVGGLLAEFPQRAPANAGPLHTQFAASRDGVKWNRFDRRPFVDIGMKGSFDDKEARVFYGMVPSVDGNELYMYYVGGDTLHGWGRDDRNNQLFRDAGLAPRDETSIISRVVLRKDGFISARAAYTGGEFATPPLKFDGKALVLNVDTSATGLLRCELQDAGGKAIEGFALDDCDIIHTTNELNRPVRWKGKSDLAPLAGKPVRLRFSYRDADVYAFQFTR